MSNQSSCEALLRGRLGELEGVLRDVARRVSPPEPPSGVVVVTGIGGSEGPARMMAGLLQTQARARAAFVPLSAFATEAPEARGDVLIVFSQNLSPNARLALARAGDFTDRWLFTSTPDDPAINRFERGGGKVALLPPLREEGALVRILGPCAAMLAAALHTGSVPRSEVEALVLALRGTAGGLPSVPCAGRVAFVTAGGYGELCRAAKNVWLEALSAPEPPMWDVLEVAHGPFQQFFDAEITLVALEREGPERFLFDRLEQMLAPERHRLVRLRSSLPAPLAPIEHLTQVVELACRVLAASPRDLGAWVGSGLDAPLYAIGSEPPRG